MDEHNDLLTPEQRQAAAKEAMRILSARMQEEKQEKVLRYRRLNRLVRPHQVLFAGSSLMEQFPIYELLLDKQLPYTIYNRGIGGFTTQELLASMDDCIYDLQPSRIFINIGTNDLNGPDYSEEALMDRYRQILRGIKAHLPDAAVYTLAYYPVNPEAAEVVPYIRNILRHRTNERISSANKALKRLAEEEGVGFIDCNAGITDEKGQLKACYTIEGMHMYGDGYVPVLEALLPYLT